MSRRYSKEKRERAMEQVRESIQRYLPGDVRSSQWCSCTVEGEGFDLRQVRDPDCICCNAREGRLEQARRVLCRA